MARNMFLRSCWCFSCSRNYRHGKCRETSRSNDDPNNAFQTEHSGIFELAIGGLVFISGIFFFKCDGVIPFAHAIWHCFVFLGAAIHYYAVYTYLLVSSASSQDELKYQR